MKNKCFLTVSIVLMTGIMFTSCDPAKSMKSVKLSSEVDSVSYILGKAQSSGMKTQMEAWPVKGNMDAFVAGFLEGLEANDSIFLGKDMQAAGDFVNRFFQTAQLKAMEEKKVEDAKFFDENGRQSGVITTQSGLQYKVITEGTGPKPAAEKTVKVHYHGQFLSGEVFDSSIERGEPQDLPVTNDIKGLTEGLQLMPVGSKYFFWIPRELGFNDPNHPLYQILTFEVELLEIV